MSKLNDDKLMNLKGGATDISSSVINAFTNIIKVLYDAGHSVGSGIRRIVEGNLCPIE